MTSSTAESPTVVYICSHARSGSTLLDQLLGAHPDICSIGEILHVNAYVREDRTDYDPNHPLTCICGQSVLQCEFWKQVESSMKRSLGTFRLNPYTIRSVGDLMTLRRRGFIARQVEKSPARYGNPVWRMLSGGSRTAVDSFLLFDAIATVSGSPVIVDSSKSIFRFLSLFAERPESTNLVLLVRDYRGVVHSGTRRGRSITESARGWSRKLRQMDLLQTEIPPSKVFVIRYEDLCANPETTMRNLCEFIGVEFVSSVLSRQLAGNHHIGGSPSKFEAGKEEIRLDTRYQTVFSEQQIQHMRRIVGPVAKKWNYG